MKLFVAVLLAGFNLAASQESDLALHAERAQEAQQRGNFRKAAEEWEAIVKLRPALPEGYSNAGMMWHFAQDYAHAIPAFRQALRLNSKLTAPHLFLGIDYYLTSLPAQALPELKAAVSLDPNSPLARKWLALTYFQTGDFFSAARELRLAISASPADAELLFWLSRTHLKLLFNSHARIRELAPDSTYLRRLRDDNTEVGANSTEDAVLQLESAFKKNSTNVELWFQLGSQAKILALRELNAFLERSPQSYRVFQLQAEFALAQGDDDQAIEQYRKAIVANPAAVQLHLGIGNIHMSRHQYAEAVPEYEAELRADAYGLTALERIGEAYAELHDAEHAETYLQRAIAIDPHSFEARRTLGKVAYERGDYKTAVVNYLDAVSNATKPSPPLIFQLSRAYRKVGNTAEAGRWLARYQQQLATEHQSIQQKLESAPKP